MLGLYRDSDNERQRAFFEFLHIELLVYIAQRTHRRAMSSHTPTAHRSRRSSDRR